MPADSTVMLFIGECIAPREASRLSLARPRRAFCHNWRTKRKIFRLNAPARHACGRLPIGLRMSPDRAKNIRWRKKVS